MLLLAPIGLLVLTLLALAASNLQRDFRSSWVVALIGASLAWLSLLILRLQLPLTLNFTAWQVGTGLEYAANFALDDVSWPLAFLVSSLCVAAILGQARHAVGAAWHSWAPSLIVTAAAMLAIVSADLLTLFFSWTLLDLITCVFSLAYIQQAAERRARLTAFVLNLLASFLLLAAWTLSFYGDELASVLVVVAVAFRFGLWASRLRLVEADRLRDDLATMLSLIPMAAGTSALARSVGLPDPARSVLLLSILIVSLYLAFRSLLDPKTNWQILWELGMAGMAIAAAIGGQSVAAVAFSLMILVGNAAKTLIQNLPKLRVPAAIGGAALFLGLPFSASQWSLVMYGDWSSPVVFAFLLVQGALLAAWLRRAMLPRTSSAPPEPWMRSVEWLGLAIVPLIYVLLGLGLLPIFDGSMQPPLWPVAVLAAASAALFFLSPRLVPAVPARLRHAVSLFASLQWLEIAAQLASQGLSRTFAFANLLLEGQAGVLWAMLLMALLISLAAQFGLGG